MSGNYWTIRDQEEVTLSVISYATQPHNPLSSHSAASIWKNGFTIGAHAKVKIGRTSNYIINMRLGEPRSGRFGITVSCNAALEQ